MLPLEIFTPLEITDRVGLCLCICHEIVHEVHIKIIKLLTLARPNDRERQEDRTSSCPIAYTFNVADGADETTPAGRSRLVCNWFMACSWHRPIPDQDSCALISEINKSRLSSATKRTVLQQCRRLLFQLCFLS